MAIAQRKEFIPTNELVLEHYADSMDWYRSLGEKTIASYKKFGLDITKIFTREDPILVGQTVRQWLVGHITSGPVVAMIVEGSEGTIEKIRKLAGKTNPIEAEKGTIRGDFTDDSYEKANKEGRSVRNLIHASESAEEAEREIKIWFPDIE